jgi:hypothetical protein
MDKDRPSATGGGRGSPQRSGREGVQHQPGCYRVRKDFAAREKAKAERRVDGKATLAKAAPAKLKKIT